MIELTNFDIYYSSDFYVQVIERPVRPGILSYSPINIESYALVENNLSVYTYIQEIGDQQSIQLMNVSITAIKNEIGNELILTSQQSYLENLIAGEDKRLEFNFTIPENYPMGNYTGNITIQLGNESLIQPVIIQVVGVVNASLEISVREERLTDTSVNRAYAYRFQCILLSRRRAHGDRFVLNENVYYSLIRG